MYQCQTEAAVLVLLIGNQTFCDTTNLKIEQTTTIKIGNYKFSRLSTVIILFLTTQLWYNAVKMCTGNVIGALYLLKMYFKCCDWFSSFVVHPLSFILMQHCLEELLKINGNKQIMSHLRPHICKGIVNFCFVSFWRDGANKNREEQLLESFQNFTFKYLKPKFSILLFLQ